MSVGNEQVMSNPPMSSRFDIDTTTSEAHHPPQQDESSPTSATFPEGDEMAFDVAAMTSFKWPPSLLPMLPLCVYSIATAAGAMMVFPMLPRQRRNYFGSDSAAAWWGGVFEALGAFCSLWVAGMFGLATDAYGRRPALIFSAVIGFIPFLFQAIFGEANPWPFTIAVNLSLVIGSSPFGNTAVGMAMLADLFEKDCRLIPVTIYVLTLFVGITFAPIPALLQWDDQRTANVGAAILFATMIVVCVFIRETLPADKRKHLRVGELLSHPLGPLRHVFHTTYLAAFALLGFCFLFPFNADAAIQLYYLSEKVTPQFTDLDNGVLAAVMGLSFIILTTCVVPVLAIKTSAVFVVRMGVLSLLFNSALHCVMTSPWQAFALLAPSSALAFVCLPTMSQMVSVVVPQNEQGTVNGAMAAVKGLATVLGPIIGSALFSRTCSTRWYASAVS